MAIFISLRCGLRGEGRDKSTGTRCWSDDNDDPWELAADNRRSVSDSLTVLYGHAYDAGWRLIKGEWICPCCIKHSATQTDKIAQEA